MYTRRRDLITGGALNERRTAHAVSRSPDLVGQNTFLEPSYVASASSPLAELKTWLHSRNDKTEYDNFVVLSISDEYKNKLELEITFVITPLYVYNQSIISLSFLE